MWYFILTLFFLSFFSIIVMVGRKLVQLRSGLISPSLDITPASPLLEEWRYLTVKNIKKYGYAGLVITIRLYVQSSGFLKNKYQAVKIKIKNRTSNTSAEKREISKFLKIISEYKHKIREIKHKIKEEEESL